MGVRFIIGRAGTGKTKHCFDAIVRATLDAPLGPPIYWLLPKQATFTAERMLTCDSELKAFSRARVVSFQQLGQEILTECGGVAIPEVTAIGRQMVLGHLLRKHRDELKFFRSVAHQTGLAAELDSTFAEFERSGKSVDDLKQVQDSFDASDTSLQLKVHDLHLLYKAYSDYLGQDRLDPHRRLHEVLKCIGSAQSLKGATVYVDGFYEFTDYERKFLAALGRSAASVDITLTLDPNSSVLTDPHLNQDALSTFYLTEETYRRLWLAMKLAGAEIERTTTLRTVHRFESQPIRHLEACLFSHHPKKSDASDGIDLIETPDRRSEIDAAAREIQKLVVAGMRLRDIAVLVRDMDAYHELIDASFREHNLPWFVDRRRSASHHPLIQFTRVLPIIAMRDFDHDAMMTLLKCGLVPLTSFDETSSELDVADGLENYVLTHRIRGAAWIDDKPWRFHDRRLSSSTEDEADAATLHAHRAAAQVDVLRRQLIAPLEPFIDLILSSMKSPIALKQIVLALIKTFDACQIEETLSRWIRTADADDKLGDQFEHQAEHAQVWNNLIDLLDQMAELMGEELVSAVDFAEILDSGLESFDLALTPPMVDQVLVGSVDRTRTPPALRAVIVMGLNEGAFPWCPRENSIFGDSERSKLGERNLPIDPDTQRRLLDERFLAYIALTRSTERLCLTRPLADDAGRPLAPSSFWNLLREIFPKLKPTQVSRDSERAIDCIGTPRQLATSLLRWARSDSDSADEWAALYYKFATHPLQGDLIDTMRSRAWRALSYRNEAALSSEIASKLAATPLRASVSRMETFANCPFKHFVRYGLRLEERDEQDVTDLDLGNAYHQILENLVREMVKQRTDFITAPEDFTDEKIKSLAQQIGQSLRNEVLLSNARNQYLLEHVERTIGYVIHSQREAARRGKFKPWKTELGFGIQTDGAESLPPYSLKTPGGKEVELSGKIDRVDLIEEQAAFAVIDYKLSGSRLMLESVYHGLSLQLLTYLLVLQKSAKQLGKPSLTPAAAFYVKLLRTLEMVKHPDEATPPDDPMFHLKEKPRGVFDATFISALDDQLTQGPSQVVQCFIKIDGGVGKNSDAVEPQTFAGLLRLVEQKLGEIADQIIGGDIRVAPYRIGTATPCPRCDYRSICRFDPARQGYRKLEPIDRNQVIAVANELGGETAHA